jgi:hypothetical protein
MAQHDYNIANQSGADFRADLNNALLAIATVNSGSTEPSTTFAHQLWVDTSSSVLKIRNAADNAWITTGVSITASNTFTGNLTGDVTGNLTGNVTGNVTGDLTGNADSADTLSTARTISLSGDVVGSVSFDGSSNVDIDTVVQINSITLGTDTTGDYVESMSGGTGVTVTGGTGEGSTPSIAIGQAVATTDNVTFNIITASEEFIGDLEGGIRFNAKADGALSKGDVVYISGVSGDVPTVGQAKADDASKMPAFGLALSDANDNAALQVVTFGTIEELDTSGVSEGQILYVSTTAGAYTTTAPTGESSQIQNIGKVIRSHASAGSIKVGGAGRSNATPNLDNGKIFIGNGSNQSVTSTLDTSIVVENTNLYYTTARANTDFDSRLATKDTGDLTEGTNLYYTTARVNSDFDTRLATKDTGDLTEGSNLYYTDARVNSAFDTRLATKDTDDVSEGTTNLYYTTSRANTDFDTRLATKSTTNLAEGTNLYYTTARFDSAFTSKDTDDLSEGSTNLYYTQSRFNSAFGNKTTADLTENTNLYYTDTRANSAIDARVTKAFVDALGIQATSVAADSVALGTDTTGNYVSTITGTANKITVSGSGSESANITLSLPDDVQIASDLTVAGNLTVNGTLTSLDTTNLDIEDNLFQLNAGLTGSPVNDSGMLINRGTADNGIFMWDESVDKFTLGLTTADGSATGNITLNSLGTLVANLEGAVTGTVSSLSNHDTDDLAEGSSLYYTDARSRSAISATGDISYNSSTGVISFTQATAPVTSVNTQTGAVVLDTDDIGEGSTNVYFTNARADTRINLQTGANLDLSSKSTSDLSEGSNLYYTDARVQAISINNVVEDTTPQLGGDLDLNSNDITGTGDINITGTVTADGITNAGGFSTITGSTGASNQASINSGTTTGENLYVANTHRYLNGAGTEQMRITGTSVGIGASSPSNKLHVQTNTASLTNLINIDNIDSSGNGGALAFTQNSSLKGRIKSYFGSGSWTLGFDTEDTTDALTIIDNGNVGIANSSPAAPLDVAGNFIFKSPTNTLYGNFDNTTAGYGAFRLQNLGSSYGFIGQTSSLLASGGSNTALGLRSENEFAIATGGSSERFRIDASGNVITGSTSANAADAVTLRQDGTVHANNFSPSNGNGSVGGTTPKIYSPASATLAISTNTVERMRINGSGNVGIGTDNPSQPLTVSKAGDLYIQVNNSSAGFNTYLGTYTNESRIVCDGAKPIAFFVNGSRVVDFANGGNVGINTSSPTSYANSQATLVIQDTGSPAIAWSDTGQSKDWFAVAQGSGLYFNYADGGGSGGASNVTDVLVLDNSGNVGIGGSPNFTLGVHKASVGSNYMQITNSDTGSGSGDGFLIGVASNEAATIWNQENTSMNFGTNGTERMRIDTSGNLIIGTTNSNPVNLANHRLVVELNSSTAGIAVGADGLVDSRQVMTFYNDNGTTGTIVTSGSSTAYNTSSDYRLKENVVEMTSALDRVNQLQPKRFNFIADADTTVDGFLAHEVQDIVPEAIFGEKDAVKEEEYEITPAVLDDDGNVVTEAEMGTREVPEYQGIDQSKLVPLLTKAIQEQQELINNLTARIEELEN